MLTVFMSLLVRLSCLDPIHAAQLACSPRGFWLEHAPQAAAAGGTIYGIDVRSQDLSNPSLCCVTSTCYCVSDFTSIRVLM